MLKRVTVKVLKLAYNTGVVLVSAKKTR